MLKEVNRISRPNEHLLWPRGPGANVRDNYLEEIREQRTLRAPGH